MNSFYKQVDIICCVVKKSPHRFCRCIYIGVNKRKYLVLVMTGNGCATAEYWGKFLKFFLFVTHLLHKTVRTVAYYLVNIYTTLLKLSLVESKYFSKWQENTVLICIHLDWYLIKTSQQNKHHKTRPNNITLDRHYNTELLMTAHHMSLQRLITFVFT